MKYVKIFFVLMAVLFCSCSSSLLFHDDFDSDVAGRPPLRNPPGDPVGDMIYIASDLSEAIPNPTEVISTGAITGQSLRYSNLDILYLVREVRFFSKEITRTAPNYWASWVGRLQNFTNATAPLDLVFGSNELGVVWLRITDGQFFIDTAGHGAAFEPIGRYSPGTDHTIIIRIDNRARTYGVVIFQGSETFRIGPRPLRSRPEDKERTLTLTMRFSGDLHSSASYVIDDINMSEEEPER